MESRKYIKSEKGYDLIEFDKKAAKEAQKKIKRKTPLSVSLPEEVVFELKAIATVKGIPYQIFMRNFIIDGLKKLKKDAI